MAVAIGRVPFVGLDRSGAAAAGAALMLLTGAITPREAAAAVDVRTLAILIAMMLLAAPLRLAGVFTRFARAIADTFHHPGVLLAAVVAASGVLSAVFVNDTICLVFAPIVLDVAALRRHNPLPYLLALATGSNIGSTATIVGNPQNMLIGSVSGIGPWTFTRALGPIALAGLAVAAAVIWIAFRRDLHRHAEDARALADVRPVSVRAFTVRSVAACIDWRLLMLFVGLFIVVGAGARAGLDRQIFAWLAPLGVHTVAGLSATTAVLSNAVSNVPAVMLLARLVPDLPDPPRAWLTVAMASTLAGNLTILGSIANLIVVESAKRHGVTVTLGDYARVGVPITLGTIAVGIYWLS